MSVARAADAIARVGRGGRGPRDRRQLLARLLALPRRQGGGHRLRRLPCPGAVGDGAGGPGLGAGGGDLPVRLAGLRDGGAVPAPRGGGSRLPPRVRGGGAWRRRSSSSTATARTSRASSRAPSPAWASGRRRPDRDGRMTDAAAVAVIGAGSWGTALALHLARLGRRVCLWARDPQLAREIARTRENARYLPGIALPGVEVTPSQERALAGARIAIVAVPSHAVESVVAPMAPLIEPATVVVSATKGLEPRHGRPISGLLGEIAPGRLGGRALRPLLRARSRDGPADGSRDRRPRRGSGAGSSARAGRARLPAVHQSRRVGCRARRRAQECRGARHGPLRRARPRGERASGARSRAGSRKSSVSGWRSARRRRRSAASPGSVISC